MKKFLSFSEIIQELWAERICIVGSGPSILDNPDGLIDSFPWVIRINNYKVLDNRTGKRTDIVYSYWGNAMRKTAQDLMNDNVKFLMCKCPNEWCHNDGAGGDFRWIYKQRGNFWGYPVYIPKKDDYMKYFDLLGGHVPSTGFACILDIMQISNVKVYLTGFDFFESKIHNLNEPWRLKHPDDPIGHVPDKEKEYVKKLFKKGKIEVDKHLRKILE